jgi:hypothetical protein
MQNKKYVPGDVDLDFGDRDAALGLIAHTPAMQQHDGRPTKHNTGIYVTQVPVDPVTGWCSLDYQMAEQLGYIKLDFLNNAVYSLVKSPEHLDQLLAIEPPWHRLREPEFVEQVVHINSHQSLLQQMPEPVNSRARLMMFLALIRPAKRYLVGRSWAQVAQEVWNQPTDGTYAFKKSHACAYQYLVGIHMILLNQ